DRERDDHLARVGLARVARLVGVARLVDANRTAMAGVVNSFPGEFALRPEQERFGNHAGGTVVFDRRTGIGDDHADVLPAPVAVRHSLRIVEGTARGRQKCRHHGDERSAQHAGYFDRWYVPMSSACASTWPCIAFTTASFVGVFRSPSSVSSA